MREIRFILVSEPTNKFIPSLGVVPVVHVGDVIVR